MLDLKFIDNDSGIICNIIGAVTLDDFLQAAKTAYTVEKIKKQKYQIIDFTRCTEFNLTPADMREIAQLDKTVALQKNDILIALIAPTDLAYGMTRIYYAYAEASSLGIQIFRSREQADEWIHKKIDPA
jgi:hypothetical protein